MGWFYQAGFWGPGDLTWPKDSQKPRTHKVYLAIMLSNRLATERGHISHVVWDGISWLLVEIRG